MRADLERRRLFAQGFGHGARCRALCFPEDVDYVAGYQRGRSAARQALRKYCRTNNIQLGSVQR